MNPTDQLYMGELNGAGKTWILDQDGATVADGMTEAAARALIKVWNQTPPSTRTRICKAVADREAFLTLL